MAKNNKKTSVRKAPAATAGKAGAKAASRKQSSQTAGDTQNTNGIVEITMNLNHEQIAQRAFAIWVAKGRPQGQDMQNWQEAKQALVKDLAKRA